MYHAQLPMPLMHNIYMLVLGVVNPYIDLQIYPIISGSISAVAELILCVVEMTF